MADEVKGIQTEVKWRAAVLIEARRKNGVYPWVLPPSPKVHTHRSSSTQAESPGSPDFPRACSPADNPLHSVVLPNLSALSNTTRTISSRYKPTPRPSLIDVDKENIDPTPCKQSGGLTFRSAQTDLTRYTEASPRPEELPLSRWEQFNRVVNLSRIDARTDASGFATPQRSFVLDTEDEELTLTLEKCCEGVSQLRADLRSLQKAAQD